MIMEYSGDLVLHFFKKKSVANQSNRPHDTNYCSAGMFL